MYCINRKREKNIHTEHSKRCQGIHFKFNSSVNSHWLFSGFFLFFFWLAETINGPCQQYFCHSDLPHRERHKEVRLSQMNWFFNCNNGSIIIYNATFLFLLNCVSLDQLADICLLDCSKKKRIGTRNTLPSRTNPTWFSYKSLRHAVNKLTSIYRLV